MINQSGKSIKPLSVKTFRFNQPALFIPEGTYDEGIRKNLALSGFETFDGS